MGWMEDQTDGNAQEHKDTLEERSFEAQAAILWAELVDGFRFDVEEYPQLDGTAIFEARSEFQCRIASEKARMEVLVTADLNAHTIEYTYQPEQPETAVPEGGVLTMRSDDSSIELYSADQKLTTEEARRMILEPLLSSPQPQKAVM